MAPVSKTHPRRALVPMRISPRSLGIVVKHHHAEAGQLAQTLAKFALTRGCTVWFAAESRPVAQALIKEVGRSSAAQAKRVKVVEKKELIKKTELIVVLGGDGTLLSIARLMAGQSVPVMGVNMGQLGFLTEIKRGEALEMLDAILSRKSFCVSHRDLLEVTLKRDQKIIFQGPVVNDAVISKGAIARIIGMDVSIDGQRVNNVRADGLIISTPTGSTAYSLAAGGPIIEPGLSALVITPICPHSLTQRPLVISNDAEIQVCLTHEPGHVYLTLDGQDAVDLKQGDQILIRRFKKHTLKLISSATRDYFSLLREKLSFGQRA